MRRERGPFFTTVILMGLHIKVASLSILLVCIVCDKCTFSIVSIHPGNESSNQILYTILIRHQTNKDHFHLVSSFHKSFPSHQLHAASSISLEIQASCITKRITLLNRKFVCIKVLRCSNTHF